MKTVSFIFDLQINLNVGTNLPFRGAHIQETLSVEVPEDADEDDIEAACNIEAKRYFDAITKLSIENIEGID